MLTVAVVYVLVVGLALFVRLLVFASTGLRR